MRVNLFIRANETGRANGTIPVSMMVRPACGLPGDYEYNTDSRTVLGMLYGQTDLPETVLNRFADSLKSNSIAKLLGVDLNDEVLTEIGYFID